MKSPPYLSSTLGTSLTVSLSATAVPTLFHSNGYSNFVISNENGSILWRYKQFMDAIYKSNSKNVLKEDIFLIFYNLCKIK